MRPWELRQGQLVAALKKAEPDRFAWLLQATKVVPSLTIEERPPFIWKRSIICVCGPAASLQTVTCSSVCPYHLHLLSVVLLIRHLKFLFTTLIIKPWQYTNTCLFFLNSMCKSVLKVMCMLSFFLITIIWPTILSCFFKQDFSFIFFTWWSASFVIAFMIIAL